MDERSQCPEVEVVERFVRGELPAPAAEEFRAHLEVCGVCCVIVERLREFETAGAPVSRGSEPDWKPMERRLAEECRRMYPEKTKQADGSRWGWWVPALGYGLAVILVYPAWLGIARRPEREAVRGVTLAAPRLIASGASLVDLNTTRGQQGLPVVTARAGEQAAVLSFFVRGLPGAAYMASIVDEAGNVAVDAGAIRSYDGKGNYCVVVDPGVLKKGQYRLVVKEKDRPAAGEIFEFERR
jgi:anti-sigma factor RsiW